jgi:putative transposase
MPRSSRASSCRLHHVSARGNDRLSIYHDSTDRERFYEILARALGEAPVLCHADVQMGNHYHLVLEGASEDVSRVMWAVNHRYAVSYNRRHTCRGHVFGGRFHSSPVVDRPGARALVLYIALNPVRAGFVDHPVDWPYGSYRAHVGADQPRPHLETGLVARLFETEASMADACEAAIAEGAGGRPSLATLMPAPSKLTRLHLDQAFGLFGYTTEEIAEHYQVSVRTLRRWLAANDAP